jgi:hypothetical protein
MDRRDDDDSRDYHGVRTVGSTSVPGGHIRCHGNATLADQKVFSNGTVNFSALVNTAEDLLQGEHAAWTERMTQSIAASRKAAENEAK